VRRAFRLATVERLRGKALEDAAHALGRARREVGEAVAARDALVVELSECVPASGAGLAELEAAGMRRVVLREQVDTAAADVTAARERAAAALAGWTAARARLKAVEVLHDRHREALHADDFRREQRQLDDLAGIRRRILGGEVA
jgi:flagellar FliJ protein